MNADDLGRVRFAHAPAPVLEIALMLHELRSHPRTHLAPRNVPDGWRMRVRTRFPDAARPLLNLVPSGDHVLLLDVLTPDAEAAFQLAVDTPTDQHELDLTTMARLLPNTSSAWLRRYHDSDPRLLGSLDAALRAFHNEHLAPYWSPITERFDEDVDYRAAVMRDQGVAAMLEGLHPSLHLDGPALYAANPRERQVDLGGRGVILMPSMFWTGRPLLTWDPQDPSTNVLIYPAKPAGRRPGASAGDAHESGYGHNGYNGHNGDGGDYGAADPTPALAKLMGPTRAAILGRLRQPDTTSGVADALGISRASASGHTAALRDAGLITTRRIGKSVEHSLTRLGRNLLTQARSALGE